ncbi:hypothetical protein [Variovorax sp.]|uniref:hypothetical protein n=1 Tax=Variovorax sp. TaxID=1871043 RepID=UPI003BAD7DCD
MTTNFSSPLDRPLQLRILKTLQAAYPMGVFDLANALGEPQVDAHTLLINTQYLAGHGLLNSGFRRREAIGLDGFHEPYDHQITERGIDFIADDGGLSAILGVVTIRLHDDLVKELVALRIQSSDLPAPEKSKWLDALRELPGETTKHLVLKLVDLGLDRAPLAIAAIRSVLGL